MHAGSRQRARAALRAAALGGSSGDVGPHCVRVWDQARERVAGRAGKLERDCGREMLAGASDLEMLAEVAEHASRCSEDCRSWLGWAIGQSASADVFAALGGSWTRLPPGYGRALRVAAAARVAEQRAAEVGS